MVELLEKRESIITYINDLESRGKIRKGSYPVLITKALKGRKDTVEILDSFILAAERKGKVSWGAIKNEERLSNTILSSMKKQNEKNQIIVDMLNQQMKNIENSKKVKLNQQRIDPIKFNTSEYALKGATKTFVNSSELMEFKDLKLFLSQYRISIGEQVFKILRKEGSMKFKITLDILLNFEREKVLKTVSFGSTFLTVLNTSDVYKRIDKAIDQLIDKQENYIRASAITIEGIEKIKIGFVKYNPLSAGSYIDLPDWIKYKQACVNVKNNDDKCFLWAIASALNPVDAHVERTSKYDITQFKCEGLEFPMKIDKISKFEEMNDINVNVISYEGKQIIRLHTNDTNFSKNVDLMLIYDCKGNQHYVWVKYFSRLFSDKGKRKHYYCRRCLRRYLSQENLDEHLTSCLKGEAQTVVMPKEGEVYEFKNWDRMQKVPFVIYADFEAILPKIQGNLPNPDKSYTVQTEKHVASGFCFKTVCIHNQYNRPEVIYRGENADKVFVNKIKEEFDRIKSLYQGDVGINMTDDDKKVFKNSDKCYICRQAFGTSESDRKVRDHDHLTGHFRGAAHQRCNLKFRYPSFIPVIFHNLRGYDSHFIINSISDQFKKIQCIPNNEEKYISFSLDNLRFIDSVQFMAASLESLVDNLKKDGNKEFHFMNEKFKEMSDFMLGKGIYFYEYADSFEKFDSEEKPKKEDFYSSLNNSNITDEEYNRFCDVWEKMKIKNLGEYHDLYLATDVLQLADVFEKFRNTCINYYELDPAHYYTAPGLSWDALLKISKIQLEALSDYDKYLFFELGKRGGVSTICHRYAKANNQYVDGYDENKPKQYLIDLDANNLYGWAMFQYLPVRDFVWEKSTEKFTAEFIMNIQDECDKGYIFSVDIEYPKELHDLHSDLPFLPENIIVDKISPFCKSLSEKLSLKPAKVKKLVPNLNDKTDYVIHYRALKQALKNGLKLKKVNKVMSFTQEPWMKEYINFNTEKRKVAKNDFEKDFFKLMNNSVFGKTMENVRNRIVFQLANSEKEMMKYVNKPTFKDRVIFNENIVGIHMLKTQVILNKPIYVGQAVLDISKVLMYEFHYDFIKKKYGNKAKLMGTDTDSLKYAIETEDLYKDMFEEMDKFDFSDYPKDHFCYSDCNKKVLGKMKDELNGKVMTEFIGLRAKMYVQATKDKVKKVAKGIKKIVVKNDVSVNDYREALFEGKNIYKKMKTFRSYSHNIYTIEVNKSGLCAYDDKRWVLDDGVSTLAHGHYKINQV